LQGPVFGRRGAAPGPCGRGRWRDSVNLLLSPGRGLPDRRAMTRAAARFAALAGQRLRRGVLLLNLGLTGSTTPPHAMHRGPAADHSECASTSRTAPQSRQRHVVVLLPLRPRRWRVTFIIDPSPLSTRVKELAGVTPTGSNLFKWAFAHLNLPAPT